MFILSKLLCAAIQPLFWIALLWLISLLLINKHKHFSICTLWFCLCGLGLLGFQAIPDALLRKLENRYPIPTEEVVSQCSGIIVLGGVFKSPQILEERNQIPIGEAAERATVPLELLRKNPHLELVFTGGKSSLFRTETGEAFVAEIFFERQGIDPERIRLEPRSRNTRENAQNTAELLGKRCSET
jgi:uncharacterized SAM-binding protein YcdF (DUF218 family)